MIQHNKIWIFSINYPANPIDRSVRNNMYHGIVNILLHDRNMGMLRKDPF